MEIPCCISTTIIQKCQSTKVYHCKQWMSSSKVKQMQHQHQLQKKRNQISSCMFLCKWVVHDKYMWCWDAERTTHAKLHMHITCDQQLYFTLLELHMQAAEMQCVCEITNAWAQTHNEQKGEHGRSADSNRSIINVKRDRMIDALNASMNGDSPSEYRAWASASLLRVWAPVFPNMQLLWVWDQTVLFGPVDEEEMKWAENVAALRRGARDPSASTPVRCSSSDVTRETRCTAAEQGFLCVCVRAKIWKSSHKQTKSKKFHYHPPPLITFFIKLII